MSLKFPVELSPSLTPLWRYAFKTAVPFVLRVFTRDTFYSNLRKTDVFPLTPGAPKWKKERPKTATRHYGL